MRIVLVLVMMVAACGKRAAAPPAYDDARTGVVVADAASADAAPADAAVKEAGPIFAVAGTPELRAFAVALEAIDIPAATEWLGWDERPLHPGAKLPTDLAAAVDALLAWDKVGSPLRLPCKDEVTPNPQFALLYTARAALARATRRDDAALHATLHLAQELRRSASGEAPVRMGITIAVDAARWAATHAPRNKLLALYAIEPTAPIEVARGQARCKIEMLEHLPLDTPALNLTADEYAEARRARGMSPGGSYAAELPTLVAFWRETLRQLDSVQSIEELRRVVAARVAEADRHPTSAMVRSLGRPVPMIENTLGEVDQYRRLTR